MPLKELLRILSVKDVINPWPEHEAHTLENHFIHVYPK